MIYWDVHEKIQNYIFRKMFIIAWVRIRFSIWLVIGYAQVLSRAEICKTIKLFANE